MGAARHNAAGDHNPAFIGPVLGGHLGVNGDHNAIQLWHIARPHMLHRPARPQGVFRIAQQGPVQFLPSKAGSAIGPAHCVNKAFGQIGPVRLGRRRCQHRLWVCQNIAQQRYIARGCGDDLAGMFPQPQPKLQIVPRVLHIAPFGKFIQPSAIKLRPAQGFGSWAEKIWATAPLRQISMRRALLHCGIRSGGVQAMMPLSPNTMTSRAWSSVSDTRATRRIRPGS